MDMDASERNLVQLPAAEVLEELGWKTYYAYSHEVIGREGSLGRASTEEVLLVRYFREALKRLNPWMHGKQVEEALSAMLAHAAGEGVLAINEKKYDYILNGIPVTVDLPSGGTAMKKARLIDFRQVERNSFLAVMELRIGSESYNRRADMVGFVNGIPLVFFEFKRPDVDVENAYMDNYTDYQHTVPQLFYYNVFSILSNGSDARVGTLGSSYRFFAQWKHLKEHDESHVELKRMLKGLCTKENLLDILENFILFDRSHGTAVKILAHNHQYLGVNEAFEAYKERKLKHGRLGVFWHTQGSGKSYSMVFLTKKILRVLGGSPTFVMLTDRDELNDQLAGTFEGCGMLTKQEKKQSMPTSGDELISLLKGNRTFIFTLIQKFNHPEALPIHTDHEILVISDEAHRSQYGIFAENMLRLLPEASRIGFTGTPIFKFDNLTERTFGGYLSIYDFRSAIEDHATVPLYYENRGEEILHLHNPEMTKELVDTLDDSSLENDEAGKEKLQQHFKKQVHILMARPRLERIARDFVNHYSSHWGTGKAMFVALNRVSAVMMYELVQSFWQEKISELEKKLSLVGVDEALSRKIDWMKETDMHVIISSSQNEEAYFQKWGIQILPYRKLLTQHLDDLKKDYKDRNHPFRVAFVCDMWLTGFDVKSLTYLYMDKPMKAHNLMQAIARANRVDDGKDNGVIIDYVGILRPLLKALNDYAFREGSSGGDVVLDMGRLKEKVLSLMAEAEHILGTLGFSLGSVLEAENLDVLERMKDGADLLCVDEKKKKDFLFLTRNIFRLSRYLEENTLNREEKQKKGILISIARLLLPKKREKDYTPILVKVHEIMNRNIQMDGAAQNEPHAVIDLSRIDFDKLDAEFVKRKHKALVLETIKAAVKKELLHMLEINSNDLRRELYARYEEIITGYNEQKNEAVLQQEFEEILHLAESMTEEQQRYVREGFDNEEQLAVFDLLVSGKKLNAKEIAQVKQCAKDMVKLVKDKEKELDHWKEKEQTRANMKYAIRNMLFSEIPESYGMSEANDCWQKLYDHVCFRP